MELKQSDFLKKLQEKYYSKVTTPWGIELKSNPFKEWREAELKNRNLGLLYESIKESSKSELNNNNGFYFNLVCPNIIFELDTIIKNYAKKTYTLVRPLRVCLNFILWSANVHLWNLTLHFSRSVALLCSSKNAS